jgi:Flp pilus assembly protein TadD
MRIRTWAPVLGALASLVILASPCAPLPWRYAAQAQSVLRVAQGPTVVREGQAPGQEAVQNQPTVERSVLQERRAGSEGVQPVEISPDQLVTIGWEHFKSGEWAQAGEAFRKALALGQGETKMRAHLGLGYASVRLGKLDAARENFQKAVDGGYNLQESLPALLTALKGLGDKEAMRRYVAMLPENQRLQWTGAKPPEPAAASSGPAENGPCQALAQAGPNPPASRLQSILSQYGQALNSCADADVFLKIAQGLSGQGQAQQAKPVYARLLRCPNLDFGIRMGAFYDLAAITAPDVVREYLFRFQETARGLTPKQQQALKELAIVLDKKEMGQPGLASDKKLALARSILAADPADPDARALLAWDMLDKADAPGALAAFQSLKEKYPGRADIQIGLGYALYHSGRLDDALAVAAASPDDPSMKNLAYQVYVKQAFAAVEAHDYAGAEARIAKARAVWPAGTELREAQAWTFFGQGRWAEAYEAFQERYQATGDKRFLSPMVLALAKTGQRVKAFATAAQLASDENPDSKKAAAAFYKDQKAPILAGKASGDAEECCKGADSQMADTRGFVRTKTGDAGLSRLTEWTVPTGYSWASSDGWRLGAVIAPSFLSSGKAPNTPYAGSYYAQVSGSPQRNSLITDTTVYTPSLSLDMEGPYHMRFEAGTTPMDGPISIRPTGDASISTPTWEFSVHQKSVSESILSWVGQRDPYGSKPWGRVLRSGAQGAYVFTPAENWFLSLGGGADYIWGENVADNSGVSGNASAGRTFKVVDNELALGVFGSLKHFDRNLNFFTYGNGGYYSPDLLFIAGPFVRFRSPECQTYWYDLEGSVGYMYERTASASKYPVTGASTFNLTSGQLSELGGSYAGQTDTKLSYSAKGEAMKLLSPYFAAGLFGGVNNAASFSEAYAGLGLRLYFDAQKGFWAPKSLFRYYTPLDKD